MDALTAGTIRVRVYESDPLLTWVARVSDEWDDYYEPPTTGRYVRNAAGDIRGGLTWARQS